MIVFETIVYYVFGFGARQEDDLESRECGLGQEEEMMLRHQQYSSSPIVASAATTILEANFGNFVVY